ncbi:AraC family transcriptional regulator [Luteimonas sp. RD2P54]|uniref:AraC family transcriptional regulator n=1 Tax=Luteimonas endophytica TaxID=3042023 RepID=A0ABT6J5R4_9GAMM|nr:AraC family transcriptional regulator [Luteimonas endophytica]MDH5822144.1 AraC family transcriptional regulator [Luteimonas endophytica]
MTVQYHCIRSHQSFDLSQQRTDQLLVLHGTGRNQQATLPARWISVWLPFSDGLELESPDCRWSLKPRELLVWRDAPLQAGSRRGGPWLAVCGGPDAWDRLRRPRRGEPSLALLPAEHRCHREVRRLLVRLARTARRPADGAPDATATAEMLSDALAEQQRELHVLLPRCNGRTLVRREQTLMRLLRVHHLIRRHEEGRVDLARLAASANYSPCHLIRSYREVFGATPSEHAARLRSEKAWRLVRETDMPVCEITAALGFESQSAFCRAFKSSFGMTTTQARQLGAPVPMRAEASGPEFARARAA